jgi:excisionase family DNA binding protein
MLNQNENRRPDPEPTGDDEMTQNLNQYATTREAAEMLGVNRFWIVRLLASKKIKGIKRGHDWLVFTPSLEKYLAKKSKRGRPASGTPTIKVKEKDDGQG